MSKIEKSPVEVTHGLILRPTAHDAETWRSTHVQAK